AEDGIRDGHVTGVQTCALPIWNLEELLVDGSRGTIVVWPDAETRRTFQARREVFERAAVRCRGACREPAFTLDRELVTVEANLRSEERRVGKGGRDRGCRGVRR